MICEMSPDWPDVIMVACCVVVFFVAAGFGASVVSSLSDDGVVVCPIGCLKP